MFFFIIGTLDDRQPPKHIRASHIAADLLLYVTALLVHPDTFYISVSR